MSMSQQEFAKAQTPKVRICHLAQRHKHPFINDDSNLKEIEITAFSQFNILQTLVANPNAIVLDESYFKNIFPDDCDYLLDGKKFFSLEIVNEIKKNFLTIPSIFQELSAAQKKLLWNYGGTCVAFSLGIIKAIYIRRIPKKK